MRAAAHPRGSPAAKPGSRAGRLAAVRSGSRAGRLLAAAVTAVAVAAAAGYLVSSALAGGHHPARSSATKYGGLPKWLPKAHIPVGRIVTASPAHPWLAIEGDTVSVRLPGGSVLATAVGPAVPKEGQFPVPATTRCSFTVTLARAAGAVPLRSAEFTILDELGQLHHPRVTVRGGGAVPAVLAAGKAITLTLTAVLPTGAGTLRWAPGTAAPVVSWDFDVEID